MDYQVIPEPIIIENDMTVCFKNMKIKKSTNNNAGDGLFAMEFISKGTVILDNNSCLYKMINDLAFDGTIDDYTEKISRNNVGHIFNNNSGTKYLYALRDIYEGDELSKTYGTYGWKLLQSELRFQKLYKIYKICLWTIMLTSITKSILKFIHN